jgi:hypothetical protein
MRFGKALKHLQKGAAVWREGWPVGSYVATVGYENPTLQHVTGSIRVQRVDSNSRPHHRVPIESPWSPTCEDMFATDWRSELRSDLVFSEEGTP